MLMTLTDVARVVIAICLYLAMYFHLLYLLRKSRLWLPISKVDGTVWVLLLAAALVYISHSNSSIDPWALGASVVLVPCLFLVIAAPAFGILHPRPKFMELIGANVWRIEPGLLFLMILAGSTISNLKLRALFTAAVLMEGFWFLRIAWNRRHGKIMALDAHDLSVLNAQADGDIKAFAKKHRIRELIIEEDDISWLGCAQKTPPCPIEFYVNTLGLNTPPCCRDNLEEMLFKIDDRLTKMEIPHWIDGGTLLGAVRENGNMLPWEDDIDIAFLMTEKNTWDHVLAVIKKIASDARYSVQHVERDKTICVHFDPPGPWPFLYEHNRLRGELNVDLIGYREGWSHQGRRIVDRYTPKGVLQRNRNGRFEIPHDQALPPATIPFLGKRVPCPCKPAEFLRTMYGDYTRVDYTWLSEEAADGRRKADAQFHKEHGEKG